MEVDPSPANTGVPSPAMLSSANAGATTVMAAPGTQSSVSVAVHPLVIMNISDHWTRVKAQAGGAAQQVFGALIGKQKGRHLELMNSFELSFDRVLTDVVIDMAFFRIREAQYKEVFSDLEFLGWYTTGEAPNRNDVHIHQQMCEVNESPVLLKLNPQAKHSDKLPLTLFESVIDIVEGQLPFTLASEEAERIGVDHVARLSRVSTNENSVVTDQLVAQHGAIKMLHQRALLLVNYLHAVEKGELEKDDEVLRDIKSLCCRLPIMKSKQFEGDFSVCNDIALMAYLGALTKSCSTLNQLVNKLNVLHERHGHAGKRMKGLFF